MKKSYYAIIPADVRYSDITANAKLLYGEITALCNEKGFCWADNGYFSELYGVSKKSISNWINSLKKAGFIIVKINKASGNTRKIFINTSLKKVIDLYQKSSIPIAKKVNSSNNNTINNTYTNSANSAVFIKQKNMDTIYLDELGEPITKESSNLPKKYGGKNKIYSRIAFYYMNLKSETGNALRYFKDIAELYEKAMVDNPQDPEKEIKAHILIAKAYYEQKNLDWGLGAVIKNWNRTKNVFRKDTDVNLENL